MFPTPPALSPKPHSFACSVKAHRSAEEIDEIRSFWVAEQRHPNSDLDHFLLVCKLRPEILSPCVLSVWADGVCRCLIVGRIEPLALQPRVGYLKMPVIRVRAVTFIHEGVIGNLGLPETTLILGKVRELLANRTIDIAAFSCLREDSPLIASIYSHHKSGGKNRLRWAEHRELTLKPQPGFLVDAMRSKHRSWFRKKARDLEKASAGELQWSWHVKIDDVTPLFEMIEKIAARTYQRGLDAGFKNDHEHRARYSLFAQTGALRVMVLEKNGQPAAFWIGIVYRGTFHSESTGYIAELAEFEIGTQIFVRLVDELVKEGVQKFDFGLGDAHYKQRFGDHSWRETGAKIFGRNWKSRVLHTYLGMLDLLDQMLRSLIKEFGVADRIKQIWRRRLAKKVTDAPPRESPATEKIE